MSIAEDKKVRMNTTKALNQMPEAHAKYILEHYLSYPSLEFKDRPDLQCETESIGVEITCCDANECSGWLRDIANGRVFTKKAEEAKEKLLKYLLRQKQNYILFYAKLPSEAYWETLSDVQKEPYIQEVKRIMLVKASVFAMSGSDSVELITKVLAQAVDKKMAKLAKYTQFDRMELFISLQPFTLDDGNDVPIIHEMLQEHVFAKTPCFGAIHILIGSIELQSIALFTFTDKDVRKIKVHPWRFSGKEVFEQNYVKDTRAPHLLCDTLVELDRQVDEKIYEALKKDYPASAWDELWEELQKKYPDSKKKEESDHGD